MGSMTGEIKRHLRLTSTEERFNRSRRSLRLDFGSRDYRPREMERVWQRARATWGNRAEVLGGGEGHGAREWDDFSCLFIPFGGGSGRWKQRMSRELGVGEMREIACGRECERGEEVNRLRAETGREELPFGSEWGREQELMPKRVQFNHERGKTASRWVRTGVGC